MAEILLEINPSSMEEIARVKTLKYANTTGPNGQTVLVEGADQQKTITWTGHIMTEEQLDTLSAIFELRETSTFTDDLGRQYEVYITDFTPKRVYSPFDPWHHTYTMGMIVLSETFIG